MSVQHAFSAALPMYQTYFVVNTEIDFCLNTAGVEGRITKEQEQLAMAELQAFCADLMREAGCPSLLVSDLGNALGWAGYEGDKATQAKMFGDWANRRNYLVKRAN